MNSSQWRFSFFQNYLVNFGRQVTVYFKMRFACVNLLSCFYISLYSFFFFFVTNCRAILDLLEIADLKATREARSVELEL